MASIYVRVPHYIASYLRNLDEQHQLAKGEPVQVEAGDELASVIQTHLMPDLRNHVNPACFSERQWRAMLQGKVIKFSRDSFAMDIARSQRHPLQISEILQLIDMPERILLDEDTGKPLPDEAYSYEYMPFLLPRTVIINGKEMKVQSDYNLSDTGAFMNILRRRFRRALVRFIALDRDLVRSLGQTRSKMESMDRFLLRYDIRYTDTVREQMKKLMNRSREAALEGFDADEDHGRWSREHLDDVPHTSTRQRCPVYCETEDETYPSIYAFAKAHRLNKSNVINALQSGHRIKGLVIRRVNPENSKN